MGVVYMEVDKVVGLVVKIPNEDYWYDWRLIILMEIILKLVMGVVDMEVDKLADMLMKIPDEGFTDVNWWYLEMILKVVMDMEVDKVVNEVK